MCCNQQVKYECCYHIDFATYMPCQKCAHTNCNVEQQSDKNTNKQKDKQGKGAIGKSVKQKVIKGKKILTTIKWASLLSILDLIKIGQFGIICSGWTVIVV